MNLRHKDSSPWIDIQLEKDATSDHPDLLKLQERFNLHPIIVKELTTPSPRARVQNFGTYLFLAYQFPVYDERNFISRRAEIDFIVTNDAVVTVHYEHLAALEFAASMPETSLDHSTSPTFKLTYDIISHLLAFNQRQLRHISDKVDAIASELFTQKNRELLERISYLKRDISEYRIIFNPIGQLLTSFEQEGTQFFSIKAKPYLDDLHADYLRISQQLEDYRSAIMDFESTNTQLMNARSGDVIKVLTMVSLVTYPLTLFGTLFAIRLDGIPFLGHSHGFWLLVGMMLIGILGALTYFKIKKWI